VLRLNIKFVWDIWQHNIGFYISAYMVLVVQYNVVYNVIMTFLKL
jgi:hypothetical protein